METPPIMTQCSYASGGLGLPVLLLSGDEGALPNNQGRPSLLAQGCLETFR
jgi:hypothetical protein